ncbi:MAG TPA: class I SAM-dependent methyltransferase [Candidatus Methylomirabilis sp.]|nr:class I SAM-dependent methyltransferase [Candidatus Methylomirabilis sp.]
MALEISIPQAPSEGRPSPSEVQVPDTSVCILYPTAGTVHVRFHRSVQDLHAYDREQGWNNLVAEKAVISGANISKARNELVTWMLEETDCEWAWFIDTDMVVEAVVLPRLLCAADVSGARVIGGLCVMIDDADGPIPTIYQLGNFGVGEVTRVVFDYPEDTLIQVAATGAACLLIHRSVLEDVQRRFPDNPYPWFREEVLNGNWISEDLHFCLLANSCGHPVFVDCTTHVGHAKGSSIWWPRDVKKGRGFPPVRSYAVIPTRDRLREISRLIEQLRTQGGLDQIVVCDNGSGEETRSWLAAQDDLVVLDLPDAGIHEMWNAGVEWMIEQGQKRNVNVLFLNNDLELGETFAAHLVEALRSDKDLVAVSGNYDGREGEGLVQVTDDICADRYDGTGGFAGFAFAARGEWFQSGYRFPEECRWWYGDNDLVAVAGAAGGKVGIALRAKVEHEAPPEGAYARWVKLVGEEQLEADRAAFEQRWAKIRQSQPPRTLEEAYERVCATPSDINEHLPTLADLCRRTDAKRVIELGVRTGVSTVAWLHGLTETDGHLWSVDTGPPPPMKHPRWTFTRGEDLDPFVLSQLPAEADVVFVDTDHRYELTLAEIREYAGRVRSGGCLVLHDAEVEVFEHHEPGTEPPFPVRRAIEEIFGGDTPEIASTKIERYENNNGLVVVWL